MSQPMPPEPPAYTLLDHLGLPFYYRHTPGPLMRRGIFWVTFTGILLLILFNLMLMPFDRDSLLVSVRREIFGFHSGYSTFEAAAAGLFNQCYIIALILSGAIAPLFATFSASNERVTGTLEFLRLAPFSSTGIVLGKMFAPAYMIHLLGGLLLLLAFPLGVLGGYHYAHVAYLILAAVLSAAVLSALGAYLASQTMAFRGFMAVAALLILGCFYFFLPFAAMRERECSFLCLLSPYSAVDQLLWRSASTRFWGGRADPVFFGSVYAGFIFALVINGLLFVLLVKAASRKLDSSENTVLPRWAWLLLWTAVAFCAAGVSQNFTPKENMGNSDRNYWAAAGDIMLVAGTFLCLLALIDHPHRRERELTDACERLAGRPVPSRGANKWHAGFVGLLVLATSVLGSLLLSAAIKQDEIDLSLIVTLNLLAVAAFVLAALVIETCALRFTSFPAQAILALAGLAVVLGVLLAPVIHLSVVDSRFNRARWAANSFHNWVARGKVRKKANAYWYEDRDWEYLQRQPVYREFLDEMATPQALQDIVQRFNDRPVALFLHYRPWAVVYYPLLFAGLAALVFWLRRGSYRHLRQLAEKAMV